MPETLTPRPYQTETVEKIYAAYGEGYRRVAIVLPTGGGKTMVGSMIVADAVRASQRILWLAHRTELVDQAEERFRGCTSGIRVGVLQGPRREHLADVVVASVLTAVRPGALSLLKQAGFSMVIVDEVHHVQARTYQTILRELGVFDDDGPLFLGVTATLDRADGLRLGDTIETVAHTVSMSALIDDGFLLRPRGIRVRIEGLDLSRVKRSRTSDSGLDDRAVAAAMHDALAPAAIARAVLEHGKGRHAVAFLPSVELSKEQARVFAEHGLTAVHVDADTPKALRKEIMRRAKLGEFDVVCNVGLFTEGTDVPIWDLAVMGRPTSSAVLFQQMAGRVLRPYPGQRDGIVLDVVGVTGRHKLQTLKNLDGVEIPEDMPDELAIFDEDDPADDDRPQSTGEAPSVDSGVDGPLEHEMFDLFGKSHAAWRRSPAGRWYLPTGPVSAVTLEQVPGDPDLFDVWHGQECLHERCDLSAAMAWGERVPGADVRGDAWRQEPLRGRQLLDAFFRGGAAAAESAGAYEDVRSADWAARYVDA